jgi:hypothetical protein
MQRVDQLASLILAIRVCGVAVKGVRPAGERKEKHVSDGSSFGICSFGAGGQSPDLAAQQEMGLWSHWWRKRDHSRDFDSILDRPFVKEPGREQLDLYY